MGGAARPPPQESSAHFHYLITGVCVCETAAGAGSTAPASWATIPLSTQEEDERGRAVVCRQEM